MKKTLSIFILCALIMTLFGGQVISVSAAVATSDYTYEAYGSGVIITDFNASATGAASIPALLDGKSVVAIGEHAFRGCTGLTSVTIPYSVTTIGSGAFYGCTGLTRVVFTNPQVASIGESAFYGCENISDVRVTTTSAAWAAIDFENLYSNPMCYGATIRVGSAYPTALTVPSNITNISDYAFYGWDSLTTVTISEGTSTIGAYAFAGCSAVTSLTIPSTVKTVGTHAFYGCENIDKLYFASIGSLLDTSFDTLYSNPIFYADNVYAAGSVITSVTIPSTITSIGKNTFYGLKSLTSVTIPKTVTHIGSNAFYGCDSLTAAYTDDISAWAKISFENAFANPLSNGATLYCDNLAVHSVVLSGDITSVGDNAFANYTGLYSIVLPEGVTTIGRNAFNGCTALTDISLPSTLTTIGEDAFLGCTGIASVTMPSMDLLSDADLGSLTSNPLYYATGAYVYKPVSTETFTPASTNETISISGRASVPYGSTFTQTVYMTTAKDTTYANVVVKYPINFEISAINAADFISVVSQSTTTSSGYNLTTLRCTYSDDGVYAPKNQLLAICDLEFNIKSYTLNSSYSFSIDSSSIYGTATLTYSFASAGSQSVKIISPIAAEKITITGPSTVYDKAAFVVDFLPYNASSKAVTWSVSDTTVASVSSTGVVTSFVKNGSVTITATTTDGSNLTASKTVNLSTTKRAILDGLTTDVGHWIKEFSPTTKNYIVYISKDTSTVKFTPTYTNGSLYINGGTSVTSGKIKSISTSGEKTVVTIKRSGISDALDNTYTVTLIKTLPTTKTSISEDGKTFNITPILLTNGNHIVVALYKDGKLVEVKRTVYTGSEITVNTDKAYSSAKIMVLAGFDSMVPISEAESL